MRADFFKNYVDFYNKKNSFIEFSLFVFLNYITRLKILLLNDIYNFSVGFLNQEEILKENQENEIKKFFYFYYKVVESEILDFKRKVYKVNYLLQSKSNSLVSKIEKNNFNFLNIKKMILENKKELNNAIKKEFFNVINIINKSIINKSSKEEFKKNIFSVLKFKKFTDKPLRFKKIEKQKESKRKDFDIKKLFDFSILDKKDIDDIISMYKEEYVSEQTIIPRHLEGYLKIGKKKFSYTEFERLITEEIVKAVRDSEFKANIDSDVIDDFVWISILDDKTCSDCCEKRDNMTIKEIEKKIKTSWSKDKCKAKVPPAHINCRCVIVPIYKKQNIKQRSEFSYEEDVLEWLETL